MKIKDKDFVEIDFVARIKRTNQIFDLTVEEEAKKNNVYNKNIKYKPIVIQVGEGNIVKGLDKALIDKETNKEYSIEIPPEDAFGKKEPKLIQIISSNVFKQKSINPFPGLQINIDGMLGTVRSVSPGRVIIDFNHPLAGKDIIYQVKINKIITDIKEKLTSVLENLGLDFSEIVLQENKADITLKKDLKKEIKDLLNKKIKKALPSLKSITFKITQSNATIKE